MHLESIDVKSTLFHHVAKFDKISNNAIWISSHTAIECGIACASSGNNCSMFFNHGDGRCLITHQKVRYDTAYTAAPGFELYVPFVNGK